MVCLWTKPHPDGCTGFVQCRRDYVPFNPRLVVKPDDDDLRDIRFLLEQEPFSEAAGPVKRRRAQRDEEQSESEGRIR
jgi:hypothetical protein